MAPADRVALITGATGPLGRVVTRVFAEGGARLGLAGTDVNRLRDLAAEADLPDERWMAATGDLRSRDEAAQAVGAVAERFGRVDVVLHLVGGWAGGTAVADLDHDELRAMLDQHLWTTLNVVQAAVPGMLERGWGRVLAVTSGLAQAPGPEAASYAVAKAAEEVLLRTLSRETGGGGVTANLVAVRTIDAEHQRESQPSAKNASWTTPEEIASVLRFLASDEAAAITGAIIPLYNRS